MTKREANLVLMTHWSQAWTTLGRWQALNARLSRETTPQEHGWARRTIAARRWTQASSAVPALAASAR